MEEDKINNMDKEGIKRGLYNKQKQILNDNKQWVSELIKPLHYKIQLWIINKQIKLSLQAFRKLNKNWNTQIS